MKKKKQIRAFWRIGPYEKWKPQFPDGSGWNTVGAVGPYFYKHISTTETTTLEKNLKKKIFKITCVLPSQNFSGVGKAPSHKNTYFVRGHHLQPFLSGFEFHNILNEKIVAIEEVKSIPSFKKKLK